jgi:para-nitrobenzyl esterase
VTIVETAAGQVAGRRDGAVWCFLGIPYAAPPVGERRLRPPQPVTPWTGVRPATSPGPGAPQPPPASPVGSQAPDQQDEDCLNLNVWTPAADGGRRPVLVWIHGGAFVSGTGSTPLYRGAALAARGDVVVVTCNYRLGVLGFLGHPDLADDEAGGAAANWGLLDQVAVLRWVQENIAAFGGDPDNVTVFGESAGAMSVCDLLTMPAAAGLVRRAIAQSGPPVAVPMARAEELADRVVARLGLRRPADLRSVAVDAILDAQQAIAGASGVGLPFLPVVDGTSLPEDPARSFSAGRAGGVPFLIGTNRDEATFFMVADPANRQPDEATVLRRLGRLFAAFGVEQDPAFVLDAYRAARARRGEDTSPRALWAAVQTDVVFRIGSTRAAAAHAACGNPTWCYLFTWPSPAMDGALGACHAVEIPFVLGTLDAPFMDRFVGSGPEVQSLAGRMMDAWLAFARVGDPSHPGIGRWPRYDPARRATLVIGAETAVVEDPAGEERQVWEAAAG